MITRRFFRLLPLALFTGCARTAMPADPEPAPTAADVIAAPDRGAKKETEQQKKADHQAAQDAINRAKDHLRRYDEQRGDKR